MTALLCETVGAAKLVRCGLSLETKLPYDGQEVVLQPSNDITSEKPSGEEEAEKIVNDLIATYTTIGGDR